MANNNIGTCQRVSEFMNRVLQVASSRWRRYAEILEATACKCLVPVEAVASSRWQRDGVQLASSRRQRDAWRLKGNACKCWMAVASRTSKRTAPNLAAIFCSRIGKLPHIFATSLSGMAWPPPIEIGLDPKWAVPPDEIEVPVPYRLLDLPTPPDQTEVARPPFLWPLPSVAWPPPQPPPFCLNYVF